MQQTTLRYHRQDEAGNVVALTLLGLAVAILAGVAVLVLVGYKKQQPIQSLPEADTAPLADQAASGPDPYDGWQTYTSNDYHFSVRYPEGWAVEERYASDTPSFMLYDARGIAVGTSSSATVPKAELAGSVVSIFPKGPRIITAGETVSASKTILRIGGASARDLVLEGTAQPWATIVDFEARPTSWNDEGTIFTRAPIVEEEVEYRRGADVITQDLYDPTNGDTVRRLGFVDPSTRALTENILLSFKFIDDRDTSQPGIPADGSSTSTQERSDITVTEPLANTTVASPLAVRGVVDTKWFAEESLFSVSLTDGAGTVITIADVRADPAASRDEAGPVPFVATLSFDPGSATSGTLIFKPVSEAKDVAEYAIPIVFEDNIE